MKQEKIKTTTNIEYVNHTSATPIRSYELTNGSIFYAERKIIKDAKRQEYKLLPQTNHLLELFMQRMNEGYVLYNDAMMKELWADGSGNAARIHKVINRLRSDLKGIGVPIEIKKVPNGYQLLFEKPTE